MLCYSIFERYLMMKFQYLLSHLNLVQKMNDILNKYETDLNIVEKNL